MADQDRRRIGRLSLLIGALSLAGCVSAGMKTLVGEPIQAAQLRYGPPAQVIDMPDGRRAYQFKTGGGSVMLPSTSTTTVSPVGAGIVATTTGSPGGIAQLPGCYLTFMAAQENGAWVIREAVPPKELVC